jgi:hypothetical protein
MVGFLDSKTTNTMRSIFFKKFLPIFLNFKIFELIIFFELEIFKNNLIMAEP